jgi:hypothetical protein
MLAFVVDLCGSPAGITLEDDSITVPFIEMTSTWPRLVRAPISSNLHLLGTLYVIPRQREAIVFIYGGLCRCPRGAALDSLLTDPAKSHAKLMVQARATPASFSFPISHPGSSFIRGLPYRHRTSSARQPLVEPVLDRNSPQPISCPNPFVLES